MGMSHDFEVAIEEGATMVRIGTAIFGERGTPTQRVMFPVVTGNLMIDAIATIYFYIRYLVVFFIAFTIVLMLVRHILNSLDVNPFSWHAMLTRRLSDPFLNPAKQGLRKVGVPPKYAPLVTTLVVILIGWFALQLVEGVLATLVGVIRAAQAGAIVAVIGHILYGLLSLYGLMIFIRIIFSWGAVSYRNRVMRFLIIM